MQQIKSHHEQVENPKGATFMHTLLGVHALFENFTVTKLLVAIIETFQQLQPVVWHQEKTDAEVERLLEYDGSKEANKAIVNGLFSEVSETRDGVRVWKTHLASYFCFFHVWEKQKHIYQNTVNQDKLTEISKYNLG